MQEIEHGGGDVVPAHPARMVEGLLQGQARHLPEADPASEGGDIMDRHPDLAAQPAQILVTQKQHQEGNPVRQKEHCASDHKGRDQHSIVDFLKLGLQYEGFEVQTAPDGQVALRLISEFKPHVVVLDVMMPKLDGLKVAEAIRGNKDTGVIILSAKDEVQDRIKGLEVGADDYLVKPFDFGELLARIRAVMRRRNPTAGPQLQVQDVTMDDATREVRRDGRAIELSAREFDLLRLLMLHPNQVLPRDRILDQVWGYNFFGDANNVEVYIRYLRQKLGDEKHQLIQTVRGVGYRIKA